MSAYFYFQWIFSPTWCWINKSRLFMSSTMTVWILHSIS